MYYQYYHIIFEIFLATNPFFDSPLLSTKLFSWIQCNQCIGIPHLIDITLPYTSCSFDSLFAIDWRIEGIYYIFSLKRDKCLYWPSKVIIGAYIDFRELSLVFMAWPCCWPTNGVLSTTLKLLMDSMKSFPMAIIPKILTADCSRKNHFMFIGNLFLYITYEVSIPRNLFV